MNMRERNLATEKNKIFKYHSVCVLVLLKNEKTKKKIWTCNPLQTDMLPSSLDVDHLEVFRCLLDQQMIRGREFSLLDRPLTEIIAVQTHSSGTTIICCMVLFKTFTYFFMAFSTFFTHTLMYSMGGHELLKSSLIYVKVCGDWFLLVFGWVF